MTQSAEPSTVDTTTLKAAPVKRRPGTYRQDDESAVPVAQAQTLWAAAARDQLMTVAKTYQGLITYKELAAQIQADTGVKTSMLLMNWIGAVLSMVATECNKAGEPLLSSLCVNQEGSVGPGYETSLGQLRGETPADADKQAAAERLACYKHFGAELPAGGGRPALAPIMQARRNRLAAQQPARRGAVCPTCFVEVPMSGTCGNCG